MGKLGNWDKLVPSTESQQSDNVILLDRYRKMRWMHYRVQVLYIGEPGTSEVAIEALAQWVKTVRAVFDESSLFSSLSETKPDLILVESSVSWRDPVAIVEFLGLKTRTPIVLVCTPGKRKARRPQLLKRAFAAGIQDALTQPLHREEVEETFGVLLKYRSVQDQSTSDNS